MNASDNNSQRNTSYRGVIPFFILFDLDLNANHLRLYGQIEQLESNPNPAVRASFSIDWLSRQLGINKRNTQKMATLLISKNYIGHKEVSPGKWIWFIVKNQVHIDDFESSNTEEGGCLPETGGGVSQRQGGGVSQRHPKIPKDKIPKDINKTSIVSLKKNNDSFSFEEAKNENPHNIPQEFFDEWKLNRKKPITQRVWKKTNKVMDELIEQGLPAIDAFEHMLEKQWAGMEARYFNDELNYRKNGSKINNKPGNSFSNYIATQINKGVIIDEQGIEFDPFSGLKGY